MPVMQHSNIIENRWGTKIRFDWSDPNHGADIIGMTLIEGDMALDLADGICPAEIGTHIELLRDKTQPLWSKYARHIWNQLVNVDGWTSHPVTSQPFCADATDAVRKAILS